MQISCLRINIRSNRFGSLLETRQFLDETQKFIKLDSVVHQGSMPSAADSIVLADWVSSSL